MRISCVRFGGFGSWLFLAEWKRVQATSTLCWIIFSPLAVILTRMFCSTKTRLCVLKQFISRGKGWLHPLDCQLLNTFCVSIDKTPVEVIRKACWDVSSVINEQRSLTAYYINKWFCYVKQESLVSGLYYVIRCTHLSLFILKYSVYQTERIFEHL